MTGQWRELVEIAQPRRTALWKITNAREFALLGGLPAQLVLDCPANPRRHRPIISIGSPAYFLQQLRGKRTGIGTLSRDRRRRGEPCGC